MKKVAVTISLFFISLILFGQAIPDWVDSDLRRIKFPESTYFTGFISRVVERDISESTEQGKLDAQADLVKQIRLMIKASTRSSILTQSINGQYNERESFESKAYSEANIEIVGIKTEAYYNKKENTVYVFAYVNKYELIGYYKSNLAINNGQIESILKTAHDLEANGEKAKARQQLELTKPLFEKVRYAQDLLTTVSSTISLDELLLSQTEQHYNTLTQMQARLTQAVYVYIESKENLFGKSENIISGKVKADLAHKGCSFVDTPEEADFQLKINANVRSSSQDNGMFFYYADVKIELFDNYKQKTVFGDSFSEKGGSSSHDKAGRKAMEKAANIIAEKLKPWIQN